MLKKMLPILPVLLICFNVYATLGYKVIKLTDEPSEYVKIIELYKKAYKQVDSATQWVLRLNKDKSIEVRITGKQKDVNGSGTYDTNSLYLVIKGKKTLIEKGYFNYGRPSWNKDGNKIIYQRFKSPPIDYPIGDICLLTIEGSSVKTKKIITTRNSFTDFGWKQKSNIVAFSDFYVLYLLNADTYKLEMIDGLDWTNEKLYYEKGTGYPRLIHSFIWLNNDQDLYFRYQSNLSNRYYFDSYKMEF